MEPTIQKDLVYDWNEAGKRFQLQREVTLDDESLRDGLQSPSVFDPPIGEKLEILHLMDEVGITTADLGLPGAGSRAVEDVTRLAEEIVRGRMRIKANCAARTVLADIRPIAEIAQKVGLEIEAAMFIGCSQIRKYTEDWDLDRMLKAVREAVGFAVKEGLKAMFVTEDTTRSHPETIRRLYLTAIECGARRVVVCDTVGHATPRGAKNVIRFVRELVDGTGEKVKVDWHGHNDRGLALPNALAAIVAGADQVHGCALGIGERCGNTSMDHLLVNMKLAGWLPPHANLKRVPEYVRRVSQAVKVPIPSNYPVIGPDAFETGTGVHAAAVIKAFKKGDLWLANRVYSGVPADEFGLEQKIAIGPMSGRSNVVFWLEKRGIPPADDVVERIFDAAKRSHRLLRDDEIMSIVERREYVDEWSLTEQD